MVPDCTNSFSLPHQRGGRGGDPRGSAHAAPFSSPESFRHGVTNWICLDRRAGGGRAKRPRPDGRDAGRCRAHHRHAAADPGQGRARRCQGPARGQQGRGREGRGHGGEQLRHRPCRDTVLVEHGVQPADAERAWRSDGQGRPQHAGAVLAAHPRQCQPVVEAALGLRFGARLNHRLGNRRQRGRGRIFAFQLAVARHADRNQREIGRDDQRQHLERIGEEQAGDDDDGDEDRQHLVARDAGAERLAGIAGDARDRQEGDEQDVEPDEGGAILPHRQADELQVERQHGGDRARRRRHADEEVLLPFRPVRIVDHHVEARQPERVESKRARFKAIPFRLIAPNVVTLIALCLGLTAMRLAVDGKFESATICILVAALLDGIDGRLARLLKG
ncbi:MAG: hypothetical protein EOP19_22885, partial [Hyphomicrobiales bacterium]